MAQPLVAVGDHGAAAIPTATPHNVDGVDGERVGGAHYPTDIGVMAEVFDRHMQRVSPLVYVGDDRLARPIPVGVHDIAGVAVAQQRRVVPRVVGRRSGPGSDSACRNAPFGGTGLSHRVVQTAAWVPTTATVAYSSASLMSPWVHSDALTCTASSDASGRISTDDP